MDEVPLKKPLIPLSGRKAAYVLTTVYREVVCVTFGRISTGMNILQYTNKDRNEAITRKLVEAIGLPAETWRAVVFDVFQQENNWYVYFVVETDDAYYEHWAYVDFKRFNNIVYRCVREESGLKGKAALNLCRPRDLRAALASKPMNDVYVLWNCNSPEMVERFKEEKKNE